MASSKQSNKPIGLANRDVQTNLDPATQMAVQNYLDTQFSGFFKDTARSMEKLGILLAERGDGSKASVLRGDLQSLAAMERSPGSIPITTAPTMDEFNLLVSDLRTLWAQIATIASLLGAKQ